MRNYWGYNSIGYFAPESRYSVSVQLTAPSMREVFVVDFPHERKPRSCNAEATKP
jgi:1,4-alpha-glucan branching enzyme